MRFSILLAMTLLLLGLASGCGSADNASPAPPGGDPAGIDGNAGETSGATDSGPSSPPAASPLPTEEFSDPVADRIGGMTLDDKIGQLVMIGLDGEKVGDFTRNMIQKQHVGGIILYSDNISTAKQTVELLNELKATNASNSVPLWLGVDQEGGRVSRFPAEIAKFPSAAKLGARNDTAYTRRIGEALGASLQAFGFNMDFAPVLDINSNPDNPVIGDRSFGANADTVIRHGLEMMNGIRSHDVAAVIKHFPGHGDTSVDSHYTLPVVEKSMKELESLELRPFAEAIAHEADVIMMAHLLIPALDEKLPASISESIISGLLRDRMGYEGVVVTDDMTMGGLLEGHNIGDAAVQAILAGVDLLLVGHKQALQQEVLDALRANVEQGVITEARLDESLYRLLRLKQKYGLADEAAADIDVEAVNATIKSAMAEPKN